MEQKIESGQLMTEPDKNIIQQASLEMPLPFILSEKTNGELSEYLKKAKLDPMASHY